MTPALLGGYASSADAAPTCLSILRSASSPTKATSVAFSVLFSESVTGVDTGDFSIDSSGLSGASVTGVTAIDAATYVVSVSTGTGNGTLSIDLVDNDSISATVGGAKLGGAGAGNGSYTSGQSYAIDKTAPTVTLSRVTATPTNSDPVQFDASFSEPVDAFTADGVVVARTGSVANTGVEVEAVTSSKYRISVAGLTGSGSITVALAAGATTDLADNATPTAGPSNPIKVDRIAPTATISTDSNDIGDATSAEFSVVFSKAVTGFAKSDVTVTHTGTANTGITVEAVSDKTYTVTVSGLSGDGSFVLGIKSNAVTDSVGNANAATSGSTVSRSESGGTTGAGGGNGDGGAGNGADASFCGVGGMGALMMFGPVMLLGGLVARRRRAARRG